MLKILRMIEQDMIDSNQDDFSEPSSINGSVAGTTVNTKRIKDLENLIEKKFSNKQDRKKSISIDDDYSAISTGGGDVNDDDDSKNSTNSSQNYFNDSEDKLDDYDDYEYNDINNNINNNNNDGVDEDDDDNDENQNKFNSIKHNTKHNEAELKALNEFIRLNTNFKFERLENDKKIDNDGNQEMDYDHDYNQSELENEENIRNIIQLCKNKYPELKYKITKSVKTIFKEKFRIAFKKIEDRIKITKQNELNDASAKFSHTNSKVFTAKPSQTFNNNNNINNNISINSLFKPQEFKSKINETNITKQNANNMIATNSSQPIKHSSTNGSNDLSKSSKKYKPNDESSFNKSVKTLPPITTSFDNKFLFSTPTSTTTATNSSPSLHIPTPNPLDAEFMRLAAAALRFPPQNLDLNVLNNPYLNFNNFFRTNLSNSPFGLNPPTHPFPSNLTTSSSSSSIPSNTTPSSQPLNLPVSSLTSSSSSSLSSNSNYSNLKNTISPTPKNNGAFFNPNYHLVSGHNFQITEHSNENKSLSHNNYKHNNNNNNNIHKSTHSSINGESKYTNGNSNGNNNTSTASNNNPINNIMSSYKLKLGNKASKLTAAEIQTTKTLINCYKESAAYLNRTVEELEQLLSESIENDSK